MDRQLETNKKRFCADCNKIFSKPSNLNIHMKRKHPDKFNAANRSYLCEECGENFRTSTKLKAHLRSHHPMKKKAVYTCPICNFTNMKNNLVTHFQEKHEIVMNYQILEFPSIEEFYRWKERVENKNVAKFVRNRGTRQKNSKSIIINFYCHRSGIFQNKGLGKRRLKAKGSCKINGYCPAEIKLKVVKEECSVVYCETHVGHTLDLEHIQLSPKEREIIAEKIASKAPFSDILDEIRDSVTSSELQRLHLITRKDLWNIGRSFKIESSSVRRKDDTVSLEAWVRGNNSCVLFCKPQDTVLVEFDFLNKEDFVLIIMNEGQKEILDMYGDEFACVGSSYIVNDFHLHSLLVIDEAKESFPCAFLISSCTAECILQLFFRLIAESLGRKLKPKVFMSDIEEGYYDAWVKTMGPVKHRLFYPWCVDQAWRENLDKIPSKEKQAAVYEKLHTISQETDRLVFINTFTQFLHSLKQDDDTKEFGQYIDEDFGDDKMKCWAHCYRLRCDADIDVYIESVHKTIEQILLQGKNAKTLDKTIQTIMKFVRDNLFERLLTISKEKLSSKPEKVAKKRKASTESEDLKLNCEKREDQEDQDDAWQGDSSSSSSQISLLEEIPVFIPEGEIQIKVIKQNEDNLQDEVGEYLKDFTENTVKNITTYEEFEAVKKLLAQVQPTLAALKNKYKTKSNAFRTLFVKS